MIRGKLPLGFSTAGVAAGIKRRGLDLALIYSEQPASAAALFTTNIVKAAPVLLSARHLSLAGNRARAILANSGCANACTGRTGLEAARQSARALSKLLRIKPHEVLLASTGVIGAPLDSALIARALPSLVASLAPEGFGRAAEAITTTDRQPKTSTAEIEVHGRAVRLFGMAKGAGMINPQLATMLAFIVTDAAIPSDLLRRALVEACDASFNAITVDGDTSTNDTVFVLANGASGSRVISGGQSYRVFAEALTRVCLDLARAIVRDGEGATKLIEIEVVGARSELEARLMARAIAGSLLVKTAIYGGDPNWGRIISAAGNAGVPFDPWRVELRVAGELLYSRGAGCRFNPAKLKKAFASRELAISLDLKRGGYAARVWTCDLSHEYVTINSAYTT